MTELDFLFRERTKDRPGDWSEKLGDRRSFLPPD
jgi:hypothetical protein